MKRSLIAAGATAALIAFAQPAAAQFAPTVMFSPPPGGSYAQFRQDDAVCQNWANQQVAGAENQAAGQTFGGVVIGGLLGAGIGGAIGGGRGAAIGAGAGAITGGAAGAANAQQTQEYAQQRFDAAYQQCMGTRGYQPAGGGPPPSYQEPQPMGAPPPPGSAPMAPGSDYGD
ncbi:MAG: hypothetical protein ACREFD_13170 [Stellaceae bacterium]